MNKALLVAAIAKKADLSLKKAEKVLNAMLDAVTQALKKGEKVTLIGFGSFSVKKRAAREGRNPMTGKKIKIAARKVPYFKAGSKLKSVVKGAK